MYGAKYILECSLKIIVLSYFCLFFLFFVDFSLPDDGKMKIPIVVGAVIVVLLLIFMIWGILWWKGCLGGRKSRENGNLCKSYVQIRGQYSLPPTMARSWNNV